ncbi:MAG: Rieske 2Fe-2S domain-containing protein [Rubrivivax sp.]
MLAPEPDQQLVGFMTNVAWGGLLDEVNSLVEKMESLPDGEVKADLFRLLDGIDTMHREALRRLVRLFKEGVLEKVVSDPAIHTLMELYDLLPPEEDEGGAPEPTASGKAESEQTASAKPVFPTIPIRVLRSSSAPSRFPHWVPVLAELHRLTSGSIRDDIVVDDLALVLARREDRLFAVDGRCRVDGSPLRGASLSGYTLSCPNHSGCHYDVRNGARIGGGESLTCHPVKVDDQGRVMVGLDMDFKPELPSF